MSDLCLSERGADAAACAALAFGETRQASGGRPACAQRYRPCAALGWALGRCTGSLWAVQDPSFAVDGPRRAQAIDFLGAVKRQVDFWWKSAARLLGVSPCGRRIDGATPRGGRPAPCFSAPSTSMATTTSSWSRTSARAAATSSASSRPSAAATRSRPRTCSTSSPSPPPVIAAVPSSSPRSTRAGSQRCAARASVRISSSVASGN
jgi:hypothetical protein